MTNNFNKQDEETIMQKLQAPFPIRDIEFRIGSTNPDKTQGMALAYVTSRAIQNRLDEVFGISGWSTKFREWRGKGVICTLAVKIDGEWVSKEDGAEETDIEEVKGSLSNSFKRASVHFGIGRYLYRLEAQWVPIKQIGSGKNYKMLQQPKLPDWALPGGESQQHYSPVAPVRLQASRPDAPPNIIHLKDTNVQTEISHEEKFVCAICGKRNVTPKTKKFSVERWGQAVCFNCQQEGQFGPVNQKVSGNPAPVSAQQHAEAGDYRQPFDNENDEVPF